MAKRPRDEVEREIMDIIPERFDSDSESESARRGSRTRIVFSIALGLLVISVVGVAARHLLVGEGVPVVAESTLPVVKPDDKPIKTKPEDRGGMDVPNQDKLVLQDMGKGDATAPANEKLLPAPEKPQPLAKPAPANNSGASGAMPPAASADSNSPPPAVAPSATPVAPVQPAQQA